jgi:hypothetical protein
MPGTTSAKTRFALCPAITKSLSSVGALWMSAMLP